MAKKSFDEIWNQSDSKKKSFDEIWGTPVQTQEEALREIRETSPFYYANNKPTTAPLQNTPQVGTKDFDLGYVGEKALKGAVGTVGGFLNAGANILDNPVQSLDSVVRFIPDDAAKKIDQNSFFDPLANAGKNIAQNLIDYSQTSAYDPSKMTGFERFLGDAAGAIGGMAPSIATGALAGPTAGLAVMGTSVFGNSLDQALDEGAEFDNAVLYGIASAGVELATEKLMGGMPFLGKGLLDDVTKEWLGSKLASGTGKAVLNYVKEAVGEGAEEYIAEVAGEFLTDIYSDAKDEEEIVDRLLKVQPDAFYSFLLGSATGGVMGAPGLVSDVRNSKTKPLSTETKPVETDPMKAMINETAKAEAQKIVEKPSETEFDNNFLEKGLKSDNVAVKMEAQRLNEKKIRKLYENRTSTEKQINDIVKTMNSLGVPASVLEDYIEFDALGSASSKGIELSKKADKGITRVAVHEIKHLASTSGINNQLSQVLRSLAEMDGIDLDKSRENIVKEYAKREKALDNAAIEEELDAYIAQEYLFTEHGIKGLVRSNLTLAEKVKQLIRNIRIRISGTEFEKQLLKAEQLYTEAINEVSKSQSYKTDTERRNMYAGPKAKNANLTALERAKQMESENVSKDDIWKETGWIKKADGEWRFEIDDSKTEYSEIEKYKIYYLKDVLKNEELYRNYPELEDIFVFFDSRLPSDTGGVFRVLDNEIALNESITPEQIKTFLNHEVQHAVQRIEGFEGGTNLEDAKKSLEERKQRELSNFLKENPGFKEKYDEYQKLAGEVNKYEFGTDEFWGIYNKLREYLQYFENTYGKYSLGKYKVLNFLDPNAPSHVYKEYQNNLGEVEARDTSERMLMTAEQRREKLPKTEGYVTKKQASESYYVDEVDTFTDAEYNSFKELNLDNQTYETIRTIINSSKPQSRNIITTVDTSDAQYLVAYHEIDEFKVLGRFDYGRLGRTKRRVDRRNAKSRGEFRNSNLRADEFRNIGINENDDGLSNINSEEKSKIYLSNSKSKRNKRNVRNILNPNENSTFGEVEFFYKSKSSLETEYFNKDSGAWGFEPLTQNKIDSLKKFADNELLSSEHEYAIRRQIEAFESGYDTAVEYIEELARQREKLVKGKSFSISADISLKDGLLVLKTIKNENTSLEEKAFDINDFIFANKDRMDEKTYNVFEKRMEMYAAGFDDQDEFREAKNISANYLSFKELEEMLKEHEELKSIARLEADEKRQRTSDELNKQNFYIKKINEELVKAFEMADGIDGIAEVTSRPITNEQKLFVNRLENLRYKYIDGKIYVYATDRIGYLVDTGYYTPEELADKYGTEIANKIIDNLSPLEKSMRDFKKYNDAISEEVINETTKLAKKKFGLTTNPYEAGYMTLDGKWLDFSDKKNGAPAGTRNNDHIEASFSNGVEMNDFIKMGNIRLQPETSGFQILKEPTLAQQKSLVKYLTSLSKPKEGYFIGFADPNSPTRNSDYLVFEPNTSAKEIMAKVMSNFKEDKQYSVGGAILERSKDPAVRAHAQMEKRIRHTFLFNKKSNPLKMYDVTARIEDEFERTGKISEDLRKELFATAYEETLRSSDVPYKDLPEFKQMLQEDLNRAVLQYENTLIKERELKKFAEENDIDASQIKFNPSTGFLKNVKPEELPDKIISYKKLKASLKSDLIGQVNNYAGGKVIDELIDKAAIEIVEDGFISSPTKFKIRQEMIENGYSINADAMNDNKELYDFIKSTKLNVPRGFGREIQDYERTKKLLKTSTQDGQPIDKVYQELRSKFGEFFPDNLTNPADQYQQIYDVMAELEPTRLMLEDSEMYNAEMRQYLEDTFTDRLEDFKNQVLYRSQKDYYDRAAKKQVAYDEAMNEVSEKISEKFFKDNQEIDELKKSEHIIKGASIEDLSEIIAKIQDRGALSKTLAQNLDAMANGDVVLRAKLSDIFEKPLRQAKKTYVANQKRVLNDVYKRIVTDLGIKMGSKESAAMMWYGEGKKQLNKVKGKVESDKLEFTPYTLDDLKKDFPNTWQNIVAADKIMREYYNDYVDRINESLQKVYAESVLKESVNERRTQIQKDIREAQERLEQLKAQRTGEVGGPDLEARIEAQRKRIVDLSRQFNNVAEDVYRNKRLKKRSDYYHHFQEVGFAENIQQILNVDSANNIANALAGISEYTKPKSKWEKFMQRRSNTARYEEDAIKGFLKYAPAAEYKISFDPYVAQLRGTIQDMIKLSDEANMNNAKVINWLTNYTNSLAGKTNPMDRWLAHTESGRTVLQFLNKVNARVKANAVVGNLNSAVSQFYNLPNGTAVLTANGGAKAMADIAKGSKDYSAYVAKKMSGQDVSDNPINQSVFLQERYIDSTIDQFDERLIHKPAQAATFLLTFGDQVVAEQLWFSAYNQAQRLGKNDPIAYADDLVARAVGGRGIGEVPLMQQSQVVKLIAPFQVEVNNAYQLMKQLGAGALKDKDKLMALVVMYGITWIMNEINEALTGNRVGMDIYNAMQDAVENWDAEKNPIANTFTAAGRLTGEILSNVPMGAQVAQMVVPDEYDREKLFGEADPSRYGTGNIGINAISDPLTQLATGQNIDWQSLVTNFGTPMGGKQLNRMYKMAEDAGLIPRVDINTSDGLQTSWKPGAYNDKGELKYQIDTSDPLNILKGFVFGTYATKEGKEYLDNEYKALSEKKTSLYEKAVKEGADSIDFYKALREANASKNLTDKNGKSISNSKAALNRQALEKNDSFDDVKKLVNSGAAEYTDFGLNKTVFEWTQEEFNRFLKSLNK